MAVCFRHVGLQQSHSTSSETSGNGVTGVVKFAAVLYFVAKGR